MTTKQPIYQQGVYCESALRRTVSRSKSRASMMEEQAVLTRPPTQDDLFSASQSKSFKVGSSRPNSQLSWTRPASSMSWHSAPDLLPLQRDSRPTSALSISRQRYETRPAGLSRSRVGHELGFNMASRQALVEEGGEGQQALLGPQPMTLRFVPTRPTYLLNLQKYSMVTGCTKHVPGRRFVDFMSRNDSGLMARRQMLEDVGAPQTHFANTTKCIYPASIPFKMQVRYKGGGTAYNEFNLMPS
ncbi:hypothetical protein GUITHDRAFT_108093 [Guillardia theta CCMP2712]|uniref:Uncharacterized protein n=1 Tax=Guillardia theta (strain CCMP2712) TaxID=905079 RepID=L1JCK6_GUITC|nr:hypothetical protein GUITHDRAFT_108093 [Guillardia theta CCMP2712]EKX46057.1 hypothetical protein GUITHDRAFT_108093 [Guillardia theta CCMP2712]|eukprot:XP_005833037.1 hypothetical protein GUITHDRAFT_108093 [Guillardia theta CCMP2712]